MVASSANAITADYHFSDWIDSWSMRHALDATLYDQVWQVSLSKHISIQSY